MIQGDRPPAASDSGRFSRLRVAVGSDELLGSHSDHQFVFRFSRLRVAVGSDELLGSH